MLAIGLKDFVLFGNFEPNCQIRQIVFANIGNHGGRYFIISEYYLVYQLGTVEAIGCFEKRADKER